MVIDTNVVIALLNAESVVVTTLNEWLTAHNLSISTVTVAELLALPTLQPKAARIITDFTDNFIIVPVD